MEEKAAQFVQRLSFQIGSIISQTVTNTWKLLLFLTSDVSELQVDEAKFCDALKDVFAGLSGSNPKLAYAPAPMQSTADSIGLLARLRVLGRTCWMPSTLAAMPRSCGNRLSMDSTPKSKTVHRCLERSWTLLSPLA